jgi:hypothetical protein
MTMRSHFFVTLTVLTAAAALGAAPAAAQTSNSNFTSSTPTSTEQSTGGWTLTPSMVVQTAWDDNVLFRANGVAQSDLVNVLNPRATLDFMSHRSQVDLLYDGGFLLYRDNSTLDGYFQHANVSARRLVTPHVAIFVNDSAALVPTTQIVELVAVPFVNTGSQLDTLHTGVEAALSKYTSIIVAYDFQWVQFDRGEVFSEFLRGGHSNGGTATLKHALNATTSLTAQYNLQHALVLGGTFDVQNGDVGVERRLSEQTSLYGAVGISRLAVSDFGPARTGPAVRAGLSQHYQRAAVTLSYSRSFVPAFGFGGSYQDEELGGHVTMPIARRWSVQSSVAWRRNDPLTTNDLALRSFWVEGTVDYAVQPWVHIEVFYAGSHQTIDRPGGDVGRNRIGFQVVTVKPVRIR